MRSRIKRLLIKVSVLSVIVNTVLLFLKYRQQGRLTAHDYQLAAASLGTTLVVIAGIAFFYLRFVDHSQGKGEP